MIIISIEKPVLNGPEVLPDSIYYDDRDLAAVGIEGCISTDGLIGFLLVRYYSLDPVRLEGDHWYFGVEELLSDIQAEYGVSLNNWKILGANEILGARCLLNQMINEYECDPKYAGKVKVLNWDSEYKDL